jgi:hypothetical protein
LSPAGTAIDARCLMGTSLDDLQPRVQARTTITNRNLNMCLSAVPYNV